MTVSSRSTILPAAAAGLALAATAKGQNPVVYSGLLSETFSSSTTTSVDLNADSTTDLTFSVATLEYTKPNIVAQNGATLSTGNDVGSSVMDSSPSLLSTFGDYNSGTAYLGVEFPSVSGTTPLYGWVEYSFDSTSETGTILGYAYNNAGQDIAIGQTSAVPETSTAATLAGAAALVAGSAALLRRRRQLGAQLS